MKVLGDRVSILKKDNLLSIVILATNDRRKLSLLFFWLLAWSVCGVLVLINYFQVTDEKVKLFLIIYLSFWAYFEVSMVRVLIWRKYGKEKLWIREGRLFYQMEVRGRGKTKEFPIELINDLKILEFRPSNLMDSLNQSFWFKGGERLSFFCQAKQIRFGLQLNEEQAKSIYKELKAALNS